MEDFNWYELIDSSKVISPSLLVYPERIQQNAALMLRIAKKPERLRPHIKTHKMLEIIQLQLKLGIYKFKCSTLAEAQLLAIAGAKDILLAMQPVSIQIEIFVELMGTFPETKFSTLVDSEESKKNLKEVALAKDIVFALWLDINNGMNRTGIVPGEEAKKLYKSIKNDPFLDAKGLHVYDGHIHDSDPIQRAIVCEKDFAAVSNLKTELELEGYTIPVIIAGGTPTFPIHEKRENVELSPGTPLLWDEGYARNYTDLTFLRAAVLLTRIVSKPGKNLLCLDLGHKSVASEMSLPRVEFLGDHDFEQISQSEEHLVVKCMNSELYHLGQTLYATPIHICPTVSKYPEALTVENHEITGTWAVAARDHTLH